MLSEKTLKRIAHPRSYEAIVMTRKLVDKHWTQGGGFDLPIDPLLIIRTQGIEVVETQGIPKAYLGMAKVEATTGRRLVFVRETYTKDAEMSGNIKRCVAAHCLAHILRHTQAKEDTRDEDPVNERGKDYVYPQLPYDKAKVIHELRVLEKFANTFTGFLLMAEKLIEFREKRPISQLDPKDLAGAFGVGEPAAWEYIQGHKVLEKRAAELTSAAEPLVPREDLRLVFPRIPFPYMDPEETLVYA